MLSIKLVVYQTFKNLLSMSRSPSTFIIVSVHSQITSIHPLKAVSNAQLTAILSSIDSFNSTGTDFPYTPLN